jgi:PKD repeat protein
MKDTIPIVTVPGDTVIDGIFADTSAVFDTTVVLDETVICSNLCNVVASFEVADTILCIGDTLFLSSLSTGADNVLWYLAGEVYADTTDTFYVADSLGTYNITLLADSQFCEDEHEYDITIAETVISDFTFVINNLTVDFEEETEYSTSLTWYFGTGDTDTIDNPLYTYPDTGVYNACLVAQSSCSVDSTCYAIYINCPYPIANYSYVATGLSVDFTNLTTLADSYYWIFGDGNASSDTNATHTYAGSGTYGVCLISTNACGSSDTCLDITVIGDTTGLDEFKHLNPHVYVDTESSRIILRMDQRAEHEMALALTNILGQRVDISTWQSPDGKEYVIGTPSISPGLYCLTLTMGSYTYTSKLLIMQ